MSFYEGIMFNRYCLMISLLSLATLLTFKAAATDNTPYLYYFPLPIDRFIIERADGSETHEFIMDFFQQRSYFMFGPGWSPDGNWFLFSTFPNERPNGFVLNPSSGEVQNIDLWTIQIWNSNTMWSPDSQFLLVSGYIDSCDITCAYQTNWLYDVTNGEILAWLDIRIALDGPGATPIEWDLENGQVVFYRKEENFGQTILSNYYRITMRVTGEVIKEPIPFEEYDALFVRTEDPPCCPTEVLFTSPSGQIVISSRDQLTNIETGESIQLPTPSLDGIESARIVDVVWEPTETWALVHYNVTYLNYIAVSGVNLVSIVKNDGTSYRQLTICGASPACVGWLPEVVNIEAIATGSG
jgi:hypothetical protein